MHMCFALPVFLPMRRLGAALCVCVFVCLRSKTFPQHWYLAAAAAKVSWLWLADRSIDVRLQTDL
eukprot:8584933-Pyramimonas_sp.AAC.1